MAARPQLGNLPSADGWEGMLLEVERQRRLDKEAVSLPDAAFAKPEINEALRERGVKHAIRIPGIETRSGMSQGCCRNPWEDRLTCKTGPFGRCRSL